MIKTNFFKDHRGTFKKIFYKDLFPKVKKSNFFIKEINLSLTKKKGTIRGMHFQHYPYSEIKIVTCLKGKIFDVVIDLRKNSKTFLMWKSYILKENSNKSLFIPKGFAHGFQSMTNNSEILYFVSEKYAPKYEGIYNPLSSELKISWPIKKKYFSKKDKNSPFLKADFKGLKKYK